MMNKKVSLTLIAVLGFCTIIYAQYVKQDPKAKEILDQVSAKFKKVTSFKAEFIFQMESKATGMNEEYPGVIVVQGEKYQLTTGDGKEIYNNGKTIWTYFKEDNEVNIYNYDPNDDNMSFTKVIEMYKSGYKYQLLAQEETIEGVKCSVIDLEPDLSPEERKKNQVFKIRIHVDKKDMMIKQWRIFERNGNVYTTTIKKFYPNFTVTNDMFVFQPEKHKGVIIEDMR